jgi:hypothetical protein
MIVSEEIIKMVVSGMMMMMMMIIIKIVIINGCEHLCSGTCNLEVLDSKPGLRIFMVFPYTTKQMQTQKNRILPDSFQRIVSLSHSRLPPETVSTSQNKP